jgi:hypothetical protein
MKKEVLILIFIDAIKNQQVKATTF